jgi:dipeptidyl aminopeptidase/acylaminoacyl peptidase
VPVWSPDGGRIAYTMVQTKRREEAPSYSGVKVLYTSLERGLSDVGVVAAGGGQTTIVAGSEGAESGPRWIDRDRLVLERIADRFKRRQILVADAATGVGRVVHEDVDAKWWSIPAAAGAAPIPSPDGLWIAFVSDRDGWDHVYVVPAAGGRVVQLTHGQFEAWRPVWSPDGTRLAFDANDESGRPGSRHLGIATVGADENSTRVAMVTKGRSTDVSPQWAPDGRRLLYQHTDAQNAADLYVADVAGAGGVARVTDSMPPAVDRSALVAPELVSYAAADGEKVPAYLFLPANLDRSRKHPAVVWIHGDGTNQNYDGWHVQRNYAVYYSFHQYLLQKGYIVIAPDYRGSIGYGKKWRQGVYLDVGGKDADDAAAAATYLKTLAFVDGDRIGVWGLSYGGFFTVEAMTRTPTLFRCGVDVAGTVDYRMYYDDPYHNGWTVGRMGTPDEHPGPYDVAAPIDRVDRLVRPLLVLHGTSDINVPYLHSVRLVDLLLKHGKDVEFMTYPGEFHYFQREHVLRDAWQRVAEFFDRHLGETGGASRRGATSAND